MQHIATNGTLSHAIASLGPTERVHRMPGGRPRSDTAAAAARCDRERVRKRAQYTCNCTYPDCSGLVTHHTRARHAEWMEGEAKRAENLAGITDLAAGYPAPEIQAGLDVRTDDEDCSDTALGDGAVGQAGGGCDDVEPVIEIGPLQARSTHRTLQPPS